MSIDTSLFSDSRFTCSCPRPSVSVAFDFKFGFVFGFVLDFVAEVGF